MKLRSDPPSQTHMTVETCACDSCTIGVTASDACCAWSARITVGFTSHARSAVSSGPMSASEPSGVCVESTPNVRMGVDADQLYGPAYFAGLPASCAQVNCPTLANMTSVAVPNDHSYGA